MDAAWASWGSWGSCSKTCGGGVSQKWSLVDFAFNFKLSAIQTQSRSRDCNTAQYGGSPTICTVAETTSRSCNTNTCRKFLFVVNNNKDCFSHFFYIKLFMAQLNWQISPLAVDATWAEWGSWGSCTVTCGGGVRIWQSSKTLNSISYIQTQDRSRGCNVAQHGGSTTICTSSETALQLCNTDGCRKCTHF